MQADIPDALGPQDPDSGGTPAVDPALRAHLHRRIRRNFMLFGRGATVRYLARLTGVEEDGDDVEVLARAESVLGFPPGSIAELLRDVGPS